MRLHYHPKILNRMTGVIGAFIFLSFLLSGCNKAENKHDDIPLRYSSFRDIPGLTRDEINAVEMLQKQGGSFIYAMPQSTEAFMTESGEVRGFSALLCEWLTELFGMPFVLRQYEWLDILDGLRSGEIDFTGEITPTEERLKIYYMTAPIAERTLDYFRLNTGSALIDIVKKRPLRYAFMQGANTINTVTAALQPGTYEVVMIDHLDQVYDMLQSEEIDAFFYTEPASASFEQHSDIIAKVFLPLIYRPVSMSTQNSEYQPIISIVQKALQSGDARFLTELHNRGQHEYRKHKLSLQLSEEEKDYIRKHSSVRFAAEHYNYPVSFYNTHDHEWQGIAFDLLDEITILTGLSFELVNNEFTEWPSLFKLLEKGEASMITELLHSKRRDPNFLWPTITILSDNYALLSKSSFHNVNINEIVFNKVGLTKDTVYAELFKDWFPNHPNIIEYESSDAAFTALDKGEVDLVMSSQRRLLALAHYYELTGYKANIVFDHAAESTFGFNHDEAVLCSIVNKSLELIDTKGIADQWMQKTFDFRAKVMRAQMPWLITAASLSLCVLILFFAVWLKASSEAKHLEMLVDERTNTLELQTSTLMAIIDSTPDFIFCKDLDLKYTQCNKSVEEFFNVSRADLIGKNDVEGLNVPQELAAQFIEKDKMVFDEGRPVRSEEVLLTRDGKERLWESVKSPIFKNGVIAGLAGISRDVTERKALENEAWAASQTKSAFLANMSHEIRTPMNAITGMTAIGKSTDDLNRKDYCFAKIEDASIHLLGIINDILDISKIEAGKLILSAAEFNFDKMLQRVVNVINVRVDEKQQKLMIHIDPAIPDTLLGDEQRLAQVITNLVGNAVKFTPDEGIIRIDARLAAEENDQCTIRLSVTDTGIGISPEQQSRLFQQFQQAENDTASKFGGTGLGLAISKAIVEMMGGRIWIESEIGKGAAFIFTIQLKAVKTEQQAPADNDINWSAIRILAADSSPETLACIKEIIERHGACCDTAVNGADAIELIRRNGPYNLYYIEWNMPGSASASLIKEISAMESSATQPIINLISAIGWNTIEGKEIAKKGTFIIKPLFPSIIGESMYTALGVTAKALTKNQPESMVTFEQHCIMLVEDVEINREIMFSLLEPTLLEVEYAVNGAEAVRLFTVNPGKYDLILMDVQMPEMDGYEATRRIRAQAIPEAKTIPIIAMTANVFREDIEKCLNAGMNNHLGKPINFEEMLEKLQIYLT